MISYTCPDCKTENKLDLTYHVKDYVCKSCSSLIKTATNSSHGKIRKPTENAVLDVGMKGILDGTEYTVVAVVVKKYGSSTFWREYYLKDRLLNNAFLSESDGHWVLMFPKDKPLEEFKYYSEFEGKKYRWYESTPNAVHAATGFFEDGLSLKLSNYKEFVNGTEMVSWEETLGEKQFFWGKHIPRNRIKRAFKPPYMPNYYGVGMVQPFYYSIRNMINILGITALLISGLQLYNYISRSNKTVFEENISFTDVKNKELVSKSFTLSGGSAPMKVDLRSDVDNSWANAEISLVNENTNEITYTTQDVEYYHGYEDGESWSEGKKSKEINICGVAPGKYHFRISAVNENSGKATTSVSYPGNPGTMVSISPGGFVEVLDLSTGNIITYGDVETYKRDSAAAAQKISADSAAGVNQAPVPLSEPTTDNSEKTIYLKATWLPVSLWNYIIIMILMVIFIAASYWGKSAFDRSKWSNSSNSPYSS